jgi:hypothetical protein
MLIVSEPFMPSSEETSRIIRMPEPYLRLGYVQPCQFNEMLVRAIQQIWPDEQPTSFSLLASLYKIAD